MKLPKQRLIASLSFSGDAGEAMGFYADILPGATIEDLAHYGQGDPHGDVGKVLHGVLDFAGQKIAFMDMPAAYPAPGFNWAISLLLQCQDEAEFDAIFEGFSKGGAIIMGPEPVLHMRKCAWVTDRFNVTWQLVWE